MKISAMGLRGCDKQGCGYYLASRGGRVHNGLDLCLSDGNSLPENTEVQCGFSGVVVKVGLAYSQKERQHIRYIAIKMLGEYYCRLFYVDPKVSVGDNISKETVIGLSQTLGDFMPNITEHVHVEFYKLKDLNKGVHNKSNFLYVDPTPIIEVLR